MAAVAIEISGVLYDKHKRTTQSVVLRGMAQVIGLEVGGGPIIPGDGGGDPPVIWGGGNVPMPSPPISNVPGAPGYIPPRPSEPPPDNATKPPPDDGGWGYFPEYGWGYFPKPGEAGPK